MIKWFKGFLSISSSLTSFTAGALKQTFKTSADLFAFFTGDKEIDRLLEKLNQNKFLYEQKLKNIKRDYPYIDSAIISGLYLPQFTGFFRSNTTKVLSQDVVEAYNYAFPTIAAKKSFTDHWSSFDNDSAREGFINAVKGKLFEVKYSKFLNKNLDDGYHAYMSPTQNQKHWDIKIEGPDAEFTQYLQLKATTNIKYIESALKDNPNIDIVTLEDLEGQLALNGSSLMFSDISNYDLLNEINESVQPESDLLIPPLIGLSWILFDEFKQNKSYLYKSFKAGKRTTNLMLNATIISGIGLYGIPLIFLKEGILENGSQKRLLVKKLKDLLKKQKQAKKNKETKVYSRRDFMKGFAGAGIFIATKGKIL